MPSLPVPFDDAADRVGRRQLARARRLQDEAELEVFRHGLAARARAEMDRQDSEAIADALRTAYEEEALFYQDGIATANGSAVLVELLTRKLSLMTTVNNRRANRRFGA